MLLSWTGVGTDYKCRTNLNTKVPDSVQLGGPELTVDRTIFEMWLGL